MSNAKANGNANKIEAHKNIQLNSVLFQGTNLRCSLLNTHILIRVTISQL